MDNRLIESVCRKVLQEYMGVSDDVTEISEELFGLMMDRFRTEDWYIYNDGLRDPNGETIYCKIVDIMLVGENAPMPNLKSSNIFDELKVTFFSYDANEIAFEDIKDYLVDKNLLHFGYFPQSKRIELKFPIGLNGEMDNNARNFIYTKLHHEVKHAFQAAKRGKMDISDAYTNSTSGYKYSEDDTSAMKLMTMSINNCYYVLDSDEIDARLQEIYYELVNGGGDLNNSKAYKRVMDAINDYKWLVNKVIKPMEKSFDYTYYEKERGMFVEVLKRELGNDVTPKMFFRHCQNGIRKFNEQLRRIVGRYRQENNLSNGSFKSYANSEIPQGKVFNDLSKYNNPLSRIMRSIKRRKNRLMSKS